MKRATRDPLPPGDVCFYRTQWAGALRRAGLTFRAIRQVMNITPDRARTYVAKANRKGIKP